MGLQRTLQTGDTKFKKWKLRGSRGTVRKTKRMNNGERERETECEKQAKGKNFEKKGRGLSSLSQVSQMD